MLDPAGEPPVRAVDPNDGYLLALAALSGPYSCRATRTSRS